MKEAWVQFLKNVSDKELARYIASWEQALAWYDIETYSYNSMARALAGAYEVRDSRKQEHRTRASISRGAAFSVRAVGLRLSRVQRVLGFARSGALRRAARSIASIRMVFGWIIPAVASSISAMVFRGRLRLAVRPMRKRAVRNGRSSRRRSASLFGLALPACA